MSTTGATSWYLGPQFQLSLGDHFTATLGLDLPLHQSVNGFQVAADYRLHGGLAWRF